MKRNKIISIYIIYLLSDYDDQESCVVWFTTKKKNEKSKTGAVWTLKGLLYNIMTQCEQGEWLNDNELLSVSILISVQQF